MDDYATRYNEIWRAFSSAVSTLSSDLFRLAGSDEEVDLDNLLSSLQSIPYYQAPKLFSGLPLDSERQNIGSVTGLFFEIMTASIVIGYIKKRVPEAVTELNKCSVAKIREIARDPDLFIHYGGRHIVFELKTSPKTVDLNKSMWLHPKYENLGDTKYFLVGGHVSTDSKYLEDFASEKWACFTSASSGNETALATLPSLDDLLSDAVEFLQGH